MYTIIQGIDQHSKYYAVRKGSKGYKSYQNLTELKRKNKCLKCSNCGQTIGLNTKMRSQDTPISSKPDEAFNYYCTTCFKQKKVAQQL